MLKINDLSYWEIDTYLKNVDFLIIGAGIVGFSAALELRKKYPKAKILIIERGFLPTGASSKNAGFSCFGSATELVDDLTHISENDVWNTVEMRWRGLQKLKSIIGVENLDLQVNGSWDLITENTNEINIYNETIDKLAYINQKTFEITNEKDIYSIDDSTGKKFGLNGIKSSFYNRLEGQINTGKMISRFHQLALQKDIYCLFGIEAKTIENFENKCKIETNIGIISASKIAICTNGFAKQFLPNEDVKPARAQVLITKPIENLKLKGTFHYQKGYYYFRNIDNRILLGGGRNLDFEGETTTSFLQTEQIKNALKNLLKDVICPDQNYEIEHFWSGIMGVGETKKPIIKLIKPNIAVGVRLGGMGVAIGSLVGEEISTLL
ncbi:MAG: FAD-binding oxidoreductase [Flavobacteriia bacterium]|nr:FAD-binding oxidoreductase [Flavobacteriia bacterium]